MTSEKIEQIDFGARIKVLPLLAVSPFFVFYALMCWLEIRRFPDSEDYSLEIFWVLPLVLIFLVAVVSLSTLAKGMKFTEKGIRRRTVLPPRFIEWKNVEAAQITRLNPKNIALELRVNRRRWIHIPLLDFKNAALLLSEIRKRLPVEIAVEEKDLAWLNKFSGSAISKNN